MALLPKQQRGGPALALGALAAAVFVLAFPPGAAAATVTVGSPLTAGLTSSTLGSPGPITVANVALGESGAIVISPVDGTIISWRVTDFSGGPFRLRVLRPTGPGQFTGVGTSAPAAPATTGTETFPTSLPIQKGDLIGFDTTNKTDAVGVAEVEGSTISAWSPALPEATPMPPLATATKAEVAYSAVVATVPVVTLVSPSSGSIKGGTTVQITGQNLSGATSVTFGGAPAPIFPGGSDTLLTVPAPKATKPGTVDVVVTTLGGSSAPSATGKFTYKACVVPKLRGKNLKAAKKKLKKASCKLGRVKGPKSKTARVKKQAPKPGKALPPGSKVRVTLTE